MRQGASGKSKGVMYRDSRNGELTVRGLEEFKRLFEPA